jgi:hemerythrin
LTKPLLWRPELELGVDMMDRHHRQMVALCGAIRDRVTGRSKSRETAGLFSQLVGFTAMHFEAEEELMRRSAYPGRMDHQDRHHELSLHLKAWDDRARRRDCPLSSAFVSRLEVWVQNHILGSDRGLSRFLLNGDNSAVTMRESARSVSACFV